MFLQLSWKDALFATALASILVSEQVHGHTHFL